MAQIGSRLIDATAAKITEDFFKAFEAHLQARAVSAEVVADADAPAAPLPVVPAGPDSSITKLAWLVGTVVVLAIVYFVIR